MADLDGGRSRCLRAGELRGKLIPEPETPEADALKPEAAEPETTEPEAADA
jgi:hypothetical protein